MHQKKYCFIINITIERYKLNKVKRKEVQVNNNWNYAII